MQRGFFDAKLLRKCHLILLIFLKMLISVLMVIILLLEWHYSMRSTGLGLKYLIPLIEIVV